MTENKENTENTENKKKSEEQILFPEVVVGEITVRPWSFGILFDISPLLEDVLTKLEEKEINIDGTFLNYSTMLKIFSLASSGVREIICMTLGKDVEVVNALSMEDGIKIAVIICKQNWEIISKNALNLLQ